MMPIASDSEIRTVSSNNIAGNIILESLENLYYRKKCGRFGRKKIQYYNQN